MNDELSPGENTMELGEMTLNTTVLSVQILILTKHLFVEETLEDKLTSIRIFYSSISYQNTLLIEIIDCNYCFPIIFNK